MLISIKKGNKALKKIARKLVNFFLSNVISVQVQGVFKHFSAKYVLEKICTPKQMPFTCIQRCDFEKLHFIL